MPTIQVEARVPPHKLLEAAGQLSPSELEQFVSQVIALQTRRKAPSLPQVIEGLEARRVEYLAESARFRQISLTVLIKDLGIQPSVYV